MHLTLLPAVWGNKFSGKLWDDFSGNFQEVDVREEAEKESVSWRKHKFSWDQVANWNISQSLSNERQVLGAKEMRTALKST